MENKLEKIIDFLNKIGKLKSTFRFSEIQNMPRDLKDSSAAHSWRLALMVSILADELNLDINKEQSLEIALTHDIVESVTGDIDSTLIFTGKVTKEEKQRNEKDAMEKIKETLPLGLANKISNLWYEYEEGSTREAKFVRALDKLETLTHLAEVGYKSWDRPEFIPNYANEAVEDFPELTGVLKTIKQKLKSEFEKGKIPWKEEYGSLT